MKYLILEEEGPLQIDELTDEVINLAKGGALIIIDINNKTMGIPNKDFTDIIWKEIPDYTSL